MRTFHIFGILLLALYQPSIASNTNKSDIIDKVVKQSFIEPDLDCEKENKDDVVEVFSWQVFSSLNTPIYYAFSDNSTLEKGNYYWGQLGSWQQRNPMVAPLWSTWLNHSEISGATRPFLRFDKNWQCNEDCLIKAPPASTIKEGEPLLDSAGNPVRYEIRLNQPWFFSAEGAFERAIRAWPNNHGNLFTRGQCGQNRPNGTLYNLPTVMLKIAWKILTKEEDQSRYIIMKNDQYTYGMVAAHVVLKTGSNWPWIWSTFEHVNNFTSYKYDGKTIPANFVKGANNCSSGDSQCIAGLDPYPDTSNTVDRLNGILSPAFKKNGSPLQYYKMLGIQHGGDIPSEEASRITALVQQQSPDICEAPTEQRQPYYVYKEEERIYITAADGTCITRKVTSPTLYNPVLEPYSFDPNKDKSCIGCHVEAKRKYLPAGAQQKIDVFTDFSFTLDSYAE